jgi:hypothetical protein
VKILDIQNVYIDDAVKTLAQMIRKTPRGGTRASR